MRKLRLIEGGLAGGEPPTEVGNWLSKLDIGTIFLIRERKTAEPALGYCEVMEKTEASVRLGLAIAGNHIVMYVDPILFSQKYKLQEILGVHKGVEYLTEDAS